MKQPVVDYKQFRLSRVNEPQYAHIKLLLGWLVYFAFYFLTENLIPAERCHVMHCFIDDLVPFNEVFVIFYISWFGLIVISLLYFFLYDIQSFKDLSWFIIITQIVAMIVYILYPNRQDLRPEVFPRQNVFTWVLGFSMPSTPRPASAPRCTWPIPSASARSGSRRRTPPPLWKAVAGRLDRDDLPLGDVCQAALRG